MSEQFRVPESLLADGTWLVDVNRVNIDDLVAPREAGRIVRCLGDPHECVMYIPRADVPYDFIAGMVSDAA